jgi:uncharacterized membrane protein YeiH
MATGFGSVPDLVRVLDLTGVFANGLLGSAVAHSHRFDPVGFAALAIVSGLGGGLIRDTLLQRGTPVAWRRPGRFWPANERTCDGRDLGDLT